MLTIRPAEQTDLPAITDIYNQAILTTTATFDSQPKTLAEQQEWFDGHGGRCPLLVADLNGRVVGWASLSKWSDRCAYADTAEASLYIAEPHRGQGLGRRLAQALLAAGEQAGLHTIIARISSDNDVSIRLCRSLGFRDIGVMREVGRKFDRLLDVHLLQLIYRPRSPASPA